jgi:hypothetical protein
MIAKVGSAVEKRADVHGKEDEELFNTREGLTPVDAAEDLRTPFPSEWGAIIMNHKIFSIYFSL